MFYITAHTVTQNQFADVVDGVQLPKIESPSVCIPATFGVASPNDHIELPVILIPNNLPIRNHIKVIETCGELHQHIIADGLRSHKSSVCSTKSILSDDSEPGPSWGVGQMFMIFMALIFVLLLLTLITLVGVRVIG